MEITNGGRAHPTVAIVFLTLAGLLFTCTNFVPFSAVPSAFFLVISFLLFFHNGRIPDITKWALTYYFISLVSVLAYWPTSLLEFDFYRYDGNFILSFAPCLVLPLIAVRFDIERMIIYFLVAATMIVLTAEAVKAALGLPIVNGLFMATNAFGGFLMFTAGASFVWWRHTRKAYAFGVLAANLALLYISYSRGSEFGLLLGIASYQLLKLRRGGRFVTALVASVVLLEASILFYTYPIYVQTQNVMNLVAQNSDNAKEANILIRALDDWPRGLYAFFHSPLFGAGFGSVNDTPFHFNEPVSWFQMNTGPARKFDSAHAHNTYIHILGEQGLFGLLVFLGFWHSIYRFIRDSQQHVMVRDMLMVSFWALTFASFTEHRIPAPSNALPFMLTLFLFYGATVGAHKATGRITRQPVIQPQTA